MDDFTIYDLQFRPLSLNLSPEWERLVISAYQLLLFISLFSFNLFPPLTGGSQRGPFPPPFKGETERVLSLFPPLLGRGLG